jgi:hypothetical protein
MDTYCIAFFLLVTLSLAILSLDNTLENKITNNLVNAQRGPILPQQQNQTEPQQQQQQEQPLQQSAASLGVKILSPSRGESILIGKDLTIVGQSTDNSASECDVSVIVNSIRPYQQANPTGRSGNNNDYSFWEYLLSQDYTIIKEGINEITAKLTCLPPPPLKQSSSGDRLISQNLSKWYSINVTGIASPTDSFSSNVNETNLPLMQPSIPLSFPSSSLTIDPLEETIEPSQNNSIIPDIDISEENNADVTDNEVKPDIHDPRDNSNLDRNEGKSAGNGNDIVQGNNNDNQISGGNGNDIVYGNAGDDTLSGDNGNDIVYGEEGDDKLAGNNGDDILSGGSGDDILTGENGSDSFDCGEGIDTVSDYEDIDTIDQNCENF